MKFLLELVVPCFGSHQFHQSAATANDLTSTETETLMKERRRQKRVRVAGQTGQAAKYWRPSLSVISEHKPVLTEISQKGEQERKVRRKSEGGGGDASSRSGGGHVRFRSDDFGTKAFEPVIPAFSPTPFMF